MTDEVMKDLVSKHDKVIEELVISNTGIVTSVEHLVETQKESNERQLATNNRLEEISKYLAKQAVFSTKLEAMDREIKESFQRRDEVRLEKDKRIHARIDEVELLQKSENGCNSVRLLTKDTEAITRDVLRLVGTIKEHRLGIEFLEKKSASDIKPSTIRWAIGILVGYSILFGTYIVQSIGGLNSANVEIASMLHRDMEDTSKLMKLVYEGKVSVKQ